MLRDVQAIVVILVGKCFWKKKNGKKHLKTTNSAGMRFSLQRYLAETMSSEKKDIYACWKRIKATGRSISFNKALAMQFEIVQAVPFRTAFFVATRENVFSRAFLYLFVATLPPTSSFFPASAAYFYRGSTFFYREHLYF